MTTTEIQPDIKLLRNAWMFSLKRRAWGNRCTVDRKKITVDANKNKTVTTVQLIASPEYDGLCDHMAKTYQWCLSRSMLSSMSNGTYFVRRTMVDAFEAYLSGASAQLEQTFVPDFLRTDDAAVQAASLPKEDGGLGALFERSNYPTKEWLAGRFKFEWQWLALSVPDELPEEIRERENAKLKESYRTAQEEITFALREGFQELVKHAVEKLETKPGDKPKVFRDSLKTNFTDFFDTFNARNLMEDAALEDAVIAARRIVGGLNLDRVRNSLNLRNTVAQQFAEVSRTMDSLIAERPVRRMDMSE